MIPFLQKIMSKGEVKKIVKRYANKLKMEKIPFFAIYLFGSQAKGTADNDSDIDIAVFFDAIDNQKKASNLNLWKLRRDIDLRIEPHGFTKEDFSSNTDPVVYEIKTTGIKIV